MEIEMDFVLDLVNHLRAELVAAGFKDAADKSKVDDDHIGIRYFNVLLRTIEARPREVKLSKVYTSTVPAGHEQIISNLFAKIKRGEDLRPHQSRKLTKKKLLADDGMLNDWGIHHLHPDPSGGEHILMCHVTDDSLLAIGFWSHDKWTFKPIWDALIDSWPEQFDRFEAKDSKPLSLTDEQRANLRSWNASTLLQAPNGKTYFPIGGGLTMAGTNPTATYQYDMFVREIEEIEEKVRLQLKEKGVEGPGRLSLLFEGTNPVALLDKANNRRIPLIMS